MAHTRRGRLASALLVALAGVLMAGIIQREVVNVPYWDDWNTARFVAAMQAGNLQVRDLWSPYAGHRIFFPRLLSLGLAKTVGWSNVTQVYTSFALAAVTVVVVWRMLVLTMRERDERPFLAVLAASAALLFSPGQAQNWVQGFNIGWFLAGFSGVAAVWSVSRFPGSWCGLLGAMLLSAVASCSIGSGLAVWVVVLAGLLLRRRDWGWLAIAVWVVAALAAFTVHFHGLGFQLSDLSWVAPETVAPEERSAPLYVWNRLPQTVAFMTCTLGAPLAGWGGLALAGTVGAAGLVALGWAGFELWRHPGDGPRPRWMDALPWIHVAGLWIAAALMIASGRMVLGFQHAIASRYVTSASLFWIGLFGTLAVALHCVSLDGRLPRSRGAAIAAPLVLLALGVGYALSCEHGYREMHWYHERMHASLYYVYRHPTAPPASLQLTHALVTRDLQKSIAVAQRSREGPFLPGAEQAYDAELAREARSWNERLNSSAYTVEPAAALEVVAESARVVEKTGARCVFVPLSRAAAFQATLPPGSRSDARRVFEIRSEHAMYAAVSLGSKLDAWSEVGLYPLPGEDGAPLFRTRVAGAERVTIKLYYPLGRQEVQLDSIEVAVYQPLDEHESTTLILWSTSGLLGAALVFVALHAVAARRRVGTELVAERAGRRAQWLTLVALVAVAALAFALEVDVPRVPLFVALALTGLIVVLRPSAGDSIYGERGVRRGWLAREYRELEEWRLTGEHLRWKHAGEWLACRVPADRHAELRAKLALLCPERESPFKQ